MTNKNKISNSRVLVTGGAGFIGSNVINDLLKYNNTVVCLDNFSTGKYENIKTLRQNKNFVLIEGDIRDFNTCEKAVKNVDIVLHQAALGSVPRSIDDPRTSNDVNIGGFVNMITAAKESKVKRFVYAASSSAYGDSGKMPKTEDNACVPVSPYAITKYVNELYADVFSKLYGVEAIGLRYFNVFGEKQNPEGNYVAVIPKFIVSLIKHKSPTINGDGSITRDFTYIDNVVQANHLAAVTTNTKALNNIYNIACGNNITILKLFETIKMILSGYDNNIVSIRPVFGPERKGDVQHSLASIEKSKKLLGYNADIDVVQGLRKTIDWFWNNSSFF